MPFPLLFNSWKHHAGQIRQCIQEAGQGGVAGLDTLAQQLHIIGTQLMDLYTGTVPPADIASSILEQLQENGILEKEPFLSWVEEGGGYRVLPLMQDDSRWVVRKGDDARYVHLHPGRWSPHTLRVKANILRTAIMVLAHVEAGGGDPLELSIVNTVRQRYLDLPPLGTMPTGELGLGRVLEALRG